MSHSLFTSTYKLLLIFNFGRVHKHTEKEHQKTPLRTSSVHDLASLWTVLTFFFLLLADTFINISLDLRDTLWLFIIQFNNCLFVFEVPKIINIKVFALVQFTIYSYNNNNNNKLKRINYMHRKFCSNRLIKIKLKIKITNNIIHKWFYD